MLILVPTDSLIQTAPIRHDCPDLIWDCRYYRPVVITPGLLVTDGNRRLRAAIAAGVKYLLCEVV